MSKEKLVNVLSNFAFDYQNEIGHADNDSDIKDLAEKFLDENKNEISSKEKKYYKQYYLVIPFQARSIEEVVSEKHKLQKVIGLRSSVHIEERRKVEE